jgi:hypothetical protein
MCYAIAGIIAFITWLYILIVSFEDGCWWPLLILLFGPIAILIYVISTYKGDKLTVLVCFYAPLIVSGFAKYVLGY